MTMNLGFYDEILKGRIINITKMAWPIS